MCGSILPESCLNYPTISCEEKSSAKLYISKQLLEDTS